VNSSVSPGKVAWFVVALLVPVALLNYLDRQMLATMKASMVADIPTIANRADWGLVLGFFKWTYPEYFIRAGRSGFAEQNGKGMGRESSKR